MKTLFVLAAIVTLVAVLFGPSKLSAQATLCKPGTLPPELQKRLAEEYSTWNIQQVTSLSQSAKTRWQDERPLECPGVAAGRFEDAQRISYAVLVVPKKDPGTAYKLLIFTPGVDPSLGTLTVVDQWSRGGAANYFIRGIRVSRFFSPEWVRRLHVKVKEGILFVDAGKSEYEADVYYWADGQYRHEPIDE